MSDPHERLRLLAAALDANRRLFLAVLFVLMAFALGFAMHGCIANPKTAPQATAAAEEDMSKPRVLRVQLQILGSAVSGGPVEDAQTVEEPAPPAATAK